jgi:hypothetical protein
MSGCRDDNVPEADNDLEASVLAALECQGVLAGIRAQLRLCVAESIDSAAVRCGTPSVISGTSNAVKKGFLQSGVRRQRPLMYF